MPSYGEEFADAVAKYLKDNQLNSLGKINRPVLVDLATRFQMHWQQRQRARKKQLSESDWLTELQADPINQGIDVKSEVPRARFWLKQKAPNRNFTRVFFVNWLLKADRVLGVAPKANSEPQSADPYVVPTFDWNRIVAQKWPRDEFPNREAYEEGPWLEVPLHVRKEILTIALGVTFVR